MIFFFMLLLEFFILLKVFFLLHQVMQIFYYQSAALSALSKARNWSFLLLLDGAIKIKVQEAEKKEGKRN